MNVLNDDDVPGAADEVDDYVEFVPDQGEDEGDLPDEASKFEASISAKDWTVETLVSQMRKGRIDLAPSFQRRNAWLANRKSKLIESILLGFPIPQIVLAEQRDRPGHFFVLDGKQRLLALRQFFVDPDESADTGFEVLRLTGLEVLPDLRRLDAKGLEKKHPNLHAELENYSIRTVVLGAWNSEKLLLSLFLRLNTGSVPLSPQELRQALIHGHFIQWLDERSGELRGLRRLLRNEHPDRRMADAELMLRHLAFAASPFQYRGSLKAFLDDTSSYFNAEWSTVRPRLEKLTEEFDESLQGGLDAFGEDVFSRKWRPKSIDPVAPARFERALNRAVFDFQAFSLSLPRVRDAVIEHRDDVLSEFRNACTNDESFVRAISATTKTADAFITRHRVWQGIVRKVAGASYELPEPLARD